MSVSGSDTHADENERLRDHASRLLTENAVLRAERDRERARADAAERERDEQREQFERHVETMIEPKLFEAAERARARADRAEAALVESKTRSTLTRLDDARAIGLIFDHSREALEAAYAEFERAEEHHRWHHDQEGREVDEDDERLRVLMVIAEALDELPEPITEDAETQPEVLRDAAETALSAGSGGHGETRTAE